MKIKKLPKVTKLPPLHLACSSNSLRPSMQCIHILNGIGTATDGMILVRYDLSNYFSESTLKEIEGKLIHRKAWELMCKAQNPFLITADNSSILLQIYGGKINFQYVSENPVEYLKIVNEAINDSLSESKLNIGINANLLNTISRIIGHNAIHYHKNSIILHFNKDNKAIVVSNINSDEGIAIIMPIYINEYEIAIAKNKFKKY
jgi:hypothetical protein